MSKSSIKNTFGESVRFEMYTREVGAKDWINTGCFSHSVDMYAPLYPYFCSVSTNLSSNFFPLAHLTYQVVGRISKYLWQLISEVHISNALIKRNQFSWKSNVNEIRHHGKLYFVAVIEFLTQLIYTDPLVYENWILYLRVDPNNSIGIQCDGNKFFKCDNWELSWQT